MPATKNNLRQCPDAAQLWAFAYGTLAQEDANALEAHLSNCNSCGATLAQVDEWEDRSDSVVRSLAMLPSTDDDELAYRELYHKLLTEPATFTGQATSPTELFWPDARFDQSENRRTNDWVMPHRLGSYELIERIGGGAYGSVYRGHHMNLDRPVVIKVLSTGIADPEAVSQFWNEFKAIGRLDHPHIVRATDAGQVDGTHFLVMEFEQGIDISTLLRRLRCDDSQRRTVKGHSTELSIADACEMLRQAAIGLAFAHSHGLVHRDIKPANMLFTVHGKVRLLDLGLASMRDHRTESASGLETEPTATTQSPRGTADYMAPEQWANFDQVDHRADLYSLGCSLFKLLTGDPPFRWSTVDGGSKRTAHESALVPRLRMLRPDCPDELEQLTDRLLAKTPADRFDSAEQVASALAPFCRIADLRQLAKRAFGDETVAAASSAASSIARQPLVVEQELSLLATTNVASTVAPQVAARTSAHEVRGGRSTSRSRRRFVSAIVLGLALLTISSYRWLPERQIETGVWRALELAAPAKIFSLDSSSAVVQKQSATEPDRIEVSSSKLSLFHLGQPVRGYFTFSVEIAPADAPVGRQKSPASLPSSISNTLQSSVQQGTGVFFAFRATDIDQQVGPEARTREFQTMELCIDDGRQELHWYRYHYEIQQPNESLHRNLLARSRLTESAPQKLDDARMGVDANDAAISNASAESKSKRILQVTLGESGFPLVSWNGERLTQSRWEITPEARAYAFANPQEAAVAFAGRLGVVNTQGQTVFRQARLMYH